MTSPFRAIAVRLSGIVVVSLLVGFIALAIVSTRSLRAMVDISLASNLRGRATLVERLVDETASKALQVASVVAAIPEVAAAYRAPDPDAGRSQLDGFVPQLAVRLAAASDVDEYRIHFHLPPAVSFYRSWTDRAGDDLSGFRSTILEVSRTEQPLRTVELGRGGFVIRGIAPIIEDGEYLGSVEVYFPPTDLVPLLNTQGNAGIVLLVNGDAAESLFFEEDLEEYFLGRVGESLVSAVTAEWIDPTLLLSPQAIEQSTSAAEIVTETRDGFQIAYIPLRDFSDRINGHLVSVVDARPLIQETARRTVRLLLTVTAVVGLGLLFQVAAIRRLVSRPLAAASANLREIAEGEGDLSLRMTQTGSTEMELLSQGFNDFVIRLAGTIAAVQTAMLQVVENARDLDGSAHSADGAAKGIVELLDRVSDQIRSQERSTTDSSASVRQIGGRIESLTPVAAKLARSVADSASAVEEMTANVSSIARNLERVDEFVVRLVDAADHGRETLRTVSARVNEFVEQSQHLQEANRLIASISGQTNLLAMNAAIEAAHAGEYGRGFAVVADEIRELAENAARQSKIISAELKKTQGYIANVADANGDADAAFTSVREMVGTVQDLETGVREALQEQEVAGRAVMENLVEMRSIGTDVTEGFDEINRGAGSILREMDRLVEASRAVSGLVGEIESGTRAISESVAAVTAMSEENRLLAESVQTDVGRFRT